MNLAELKPSTILVSLLFSAVGMAYFVYGKKQSNFQFMLIGIILMVYTYFVSSVPLAWIIGIILTVMPKLINR